MIIVGVSSMGSAATYHFARRSINVLGLERFRIFSMKSVRCTTRIIRLAYYEHPHSLTFAVGLQTLG